MRQESWEKGWTTRKRGKRNERKGDDAAFERETEERGRWREVKVNGGRGPSGKRGIVGRVGV